MEETKETVAKESLFSPAFILVLTFLAFNISFAWFSPDVASKLGKILIDEQDGGPAGAIENLPDIKVFPSITTAKVGTVRVETSLRGLSARVLKNICDRKAATKLNIKKDTRKGDAVTLKYSKSFQCKSISLRLNGPKEMKAQLQTSADGIVFSAVKLLKPGSNDVKLKNETIKAVRIVLSENIKGAWTLGDVSCR